MIYVVSIMCLCAGLPPQASPVLPAQGPVCLELVDKAPVVKARVVKAEDPTSSSQEEKPAPKKAVVKGSRTQDCDCSSSCTCGCQEGYRCRCGDSQASVRPTTAVCEGPTCLASAPALVGSQPIFCVNGQCQSQAPVTTTYNPQPALRYLQPEPAYYPTPQPLYYPAQQPMYYRQPTYSACGPMGCGPSSGGVMTGGFYGYGGGSCSSGSCSSGSCSSASSGRGLFGRRR